MTSTMPGRPGPDESNLDGHLSDVIPFPRTAHHPTDDVPVVSAGDTIDAPPQDTTPDTHFEVELDPEPVPGGAVVDLPPAARPVLSTREGSPDHPGRVARVGQRQGHLDGRGPPGRAHRRLSRGPFPVVRPANRRVGGGRRVSAGRAATALVVGRRTARATPARREHRRPDDLAAAAPGRQTHPAWRGIILAAETPAWLRRPRRVVLAPWWALTLAPQRPRSAWHDWAGRRTGRSISAAVVTAATAG